MGYAGYERQHAKAAEAQRDSAQHLANQFAADLKESEADAAAVAARNKQLDAQIRARDGRLKELADAKRNLAVELDALKATLPEADKSCLDRPLPPALIERLR
jgi:septal ring factor EnvC (AmiA/AmiB activator)